LVLAGLLSSFSASATAFYVTGEAPGVLNSTAGFTSVGVETFDNRSGSNGFTTDFGGAAGLGGLTGTFTGTFSVVGADQYGGAGGSNYITDNDSSFTLTLSQDVTYFGLWVSAMNDGNVVTILDSNGNTLTTFDTASMAALIGSNHAYYGNPSGPYAGLDSDEPFAFVNFFDQSGSFNTIQISGAGFESDNFTVGTFTSTSGTGVAGTASDVPEPASFAALGMGIGGLLAARRRRAA
jgi:hypothetical protein